jgi:hypothetical protein
MRLLILFLAIALNINGQLHYFLEYNFAIKKSFIDFTSYNDLVITNNISFGVKKNKMLYSLNLGREEWCLEYFDDNVGQKPQLFNFYCRTFKITPFIERQFLLSNTKFSFRVGMGCKIFFLNQMKDSLSYTRDYNFFNLTKPSVLSKFNDYSSKNEIDGITFGSKDKYYFITSVPYALIANFAIQYAFKKWAIKLQYEPTLMRVKTRNAANSNLKSSVFFFYNNIGLGVNYPLNFKKKEKTSPPNQ